MCLNIAVAPCSGIQFNMSQLRNIFAHTFLCKQFPVGRSPIPFPSNQHFLGISMYSYCAIYSPFFCYNSSFLYKLPARVLEGATFLLLAIIANKALCLYKCVRPSCSVLPKLWVCEAILQLTWAPCKAINKGFLLPLLISGWNDVMRVPQTSFSFQFLC